jgi:hypothetical protein
MFGARGGGWNYRFGVSHGRSYVDPRPQTSPVSLFGCPPPREAPPASLTGGLPGSSVNVVTPHIYYCTVLYPWLTHFDARGPNLKGADTPFAWALRKLFSVAVTGTASKGKGKSFTGCFHGMMMAVVPQVLMNESKNNTATSLRFAFSGRPSRNERPVWERRTITMCKTAPQRQAWKTTFMDACESLAPPRPCSIGNCLFWKYEIDTVVTSHQSRGVRKIQ